jgi:hypothetical protein
MSNDRVRDLAICNMLYGEDLWKQIRTDQPPTPSEVTEWLRRQRKDWSVRNLSQEPINQITEWARRNGLKRLDWDFEPRRFIWFREEETAMLWDLSKPSNSK